MLVFLPQILILFLFILALEDSGYLPRAAYLLDRLMGSVGLSGRAFIPLLSSFACAVPGIMATRTIPNLRDRMATIMIAPLMTCSARLPVYALVIAAFIPNRPVGPFNLQGLVLFTLYVAGIVAAMAVAYLLKRTAMRSSYHPLLLELPEYHWPHLNNLMIGLWERTKVFVQRVGTIILAMMIVLWFLSSYPAAPAGAEGPAIVYSFAGMLGRALEHVFAPLGFNWQISLALVPGLAAREVAVGALGTVYSLSTTGDDVSTTLVPMIAQTWSLATALVAARVVRLRAAVPVDAGGRQARDEFLALSADDGGLPVRARLPRVVRHLPRRERRARRGRLTRARETARRDRRRGRVLLAAWAVTPAAMRLTLARRFVAATQPRTPAARWPGWRSGSRKQPAAARTAPGATRIASPSPPRSRDSDGPACAGPSSHFHSRSRPGQVPDASAGRASAAGAGAGGSSPFSW